jgi:serine/threonine protein kinase
VEKELSILQQLDHDNITSYAFIADERNKISIVMDWAGEGLRDHRNAHPELYTESAVRHMAYQLTSALLYCHQQVRGYLVRFCLLAWLARYN